MRCLVLAMLAAVLGGCASTQSEPVNEDMVLGSFGGRAGGFVMMDTQSNHVLRVGEERCTERLPPCSTFKVWNTMIALELGLVSSPNEEFWTWDGQKRFLDDWNQDLTLGRAFAVSCVPAFQSLAERIGPERMQAWLDRIDYGNRDISTGITTFWLPQAGRKTILISANDQAALLRRLVRNELPFSAERVSVLREIMRVQSTAKGELFGKTGTGRLAEGPKQIAWFVGWVESRTEGKKRAFACIVRGDGLTGVDVRAMVERIFEAGGLL